MKNRNARSVIDTLLEQLEAHSQGPLFVWAAVHDSRGGVDWVRAAVLATER